jgi:hypothetical protein
MRHPVAKKSRPPRSGKSRPKKPKPTESQSSSADVTEPKAKRKTGFDVRISPRDRVSLYAAARVLPSGVKEKCRLKIPFVTYFKDPSVAKSNPLLAINEHLLVNWEPGLTDGPTSARFAIVDYNADTRHLAPPAVWDERSQKFTSRGKVLGKNSTDVFQFHQVSVWALVQRALEFFEDANGLGRHIPWAFAGNRLTVVPHAGCGKNAFYDRKSKSLKFYYFESDLGTVYTCLSTDIVNHEFGHAVLDGVRPYYNESTQVETAAFHEFMGDLTAILLSLRNNEFRGVIARDTKGKMGGASTLASIAKQFGEAVQGTPYLRTALNKDKMSDVAGTTSPHRVSQVLVGAMFDVLTRLADRYMKKSEDDAGPVKSPAEAFWYAAQRMQRIAVQPLDLLPPVEVTFRDYALAVCRAQQLANPIDPHGYHDMLLGVFRDREILDKNDVNTLNEPRYLYERLKLSVSHDIGDMSRSRAAAYRFLDDNRDDLLIPAFQDFVIADLYDANKCNRRGERLPRQVVLEYVWREDVALDGPEYGAFNRQSTSMLCGGTLVLDENGNVLSWVQKPGTQPFGKAGKGGAAADNWKAAVKEGRRRREALLENLATQIAHGRVGVAIGTEKGLLATRMPPLAAESNGELVHFRLSPHLHLSEDHKSSKKKTGENGNGR